MRSIVSKYERNKSKKRNQWIIGIILVFIMVASTLGFALQGGGGAADDGSAQENTISYNGFEFENRNGLWVLGSFVFRNTPQQTEDIGSGLNGADSYRGLPLYIYSENQDAEAEISVNLGQIAERTQRACPEGVVCPGDLPLKKCSDNFIILKENINKRIEQDNRCVYIEGPAEELVELADQFLFKILGIK